MPSTSTDVNDKSQSPAIDSFDGRNNLAGVERLLSQQQRNDKTLGDLWGRELAAKTKDRGFLRLAACGLRLVAGCCGWLLWLDSLLGSGLHSKALALHRSSRMPHAACRFFGYLFCR